MFHNLTALPSDTPQPQATASYTGYDRYDGCYGIVTGRNRVGAYLQLDNGQPAFAYQFANLFPGTEVLCTVLKKPTADQSMLVSIDHVCSYAF